MSRAGAYVVSDLSRDRLCRIACTRCGWAGAYRRETLAAPYGDMALPDVLIALTACEHRGDYSRPCGAAYVNPPGARWLMMLMSGALPAFWSKRHGDDAAIVAAQRADELLAASDFEGCRIWKRILEAVAELTRATPAEGERVN